MNEIKESDFLFYRGEDGNVHAQVLLGSETVWVTQNTLSDIFGIDRTGIGRHIKNIIDEKEVIQEGNVQFLHIAHSDKPIAFYSLEFIIAVGYRVNSYKATKFRQWSTRILNEYLIKGFVLDDERLKQGNKLFGKDHFKELLERIREIRASERMFYEKVTDLYALSEDYDKLDPTTQTFFKRVQAKLEYAITGKTPAELIKSRVSASMPNMGLSTWKNSKRDGKITLSDVKIAKNVLTPEELKSLNTLVSAFLDHAEMLYEKHKIMKMSDWAARLDRFLEFNEFKILQDGGSIKKELADAFAEKEYNKFKIYQDENYKSDFNRFINNIKTGSNLPKESDIIKQKSEFAEPLSDFNKKLSTALNFTPVDKKETTPKVPKVKVPKGFKKCPRCGGFVEKKLNFCNNDIMDENGDVVSCGYSFGAIKGKDSWD